MDAAVFARTAGERGRVSDQELTKEAEKLHGALVSAATDRKFSVFQPVEEIAPSRSVVDTRWVLARKMAGGKKNAEARLVAKGYEDPDLKDG